MGIADFASSAADLVKTGAGKVMDTGSDLLTDLGLDTKKAVLCLANPSATSSLTQSFNVTNLASGTQENKSGISKMVNEANEIQKQLLKSADSSKIKSALNTISGKGSQPSGKSAKQVKKEMEIYRYFLPFEVQYNPKSLRLETVAGTQEYKQNTQDGLKYADEIKQQKREGSNTYLTLQLVFDDVQIGDCFMVDTGSLISNTAADQIKNKITGKEKFGVRSQVDMLISALCTAPTRQVIFFWSTMCFRGELTRANARYTMFNTKGNPVRAFVDLTIEQNSEVRDYNYDKSYWLGAFDKVFKEGSGASGIGSRILSSNNWINI